MNIGKMRISKKLSVEIVTVALLVVNELSGLDFSPVTIAGIAGSAAAYFFAQGWVDKEKEKYYEDNH